MTLLDSPKAPARTCRNGHPWTPDNTYTNPTTGRRRCLICKRQWAVDHRPEPARRFPLQPVLDELEARGCTIRRRQAEWLGVDPRQLYRWLEMGVPLFHADRMAVRLERHPLWFWPDFASDTTEGAP